LIDIPMGKALAAVEWEDDNGIYTSVKRCTGCYFYKNKKRECWSGSLMVRVFDCSTETRKDGKSVTFKLVDLPGEERKYPDNLVTINVLGEDMIFKKKEEEK